LLKAPNKLLKRTNISWLFAPSAPISDEGPSVEKVHSFTEDSGNHKVGKHHEAYLSNIRRADPEKWETIIRQPMS